MALFDPWQFSIQVCNRWDEIPQLRIRPRPKMEFLAQVLETAFVASMETEEGRHLTFGLLLRANAETDDPGHVVARFVEKRKLTTNEISRLAPATSEPSTFIAIDESDSGPSIWGTVDVSSEWGKFQSAEHASGIGLPFHLFIRVTGPGTMSLTFSDLLLFSIERGKTAQESFNVLKFGPVHEFFKPTIDALLSQSFPGRGDVQEGTQAVLHKFFVTSYGGEYFRLMARILKYTEGFGHGGTVIVVRDESVEELDRLVSIKYPVQNLDLWTDLVKYVASICDEIESLKLVSAEGPVSRSVFDQWQTADRQVDWFAQRLIDQSRLLARLTQVDGALIMTDRLKVLGFGAVIGNLGNAPVTVRSCQDELGRRFTEMASESFGTRHRSAFGLCRALESVVFIMSQDGGVKAIRSHENNVLLWRSVVLSPRGWFTTAEDMIPQLAERFLNRQTASDWT